MDTKRFFLYLIVIAALALARVWWQRRRWARTT